MAHDVLIGIHAVSGVAAFALGYVVRRPRHGGSSLVFRGYLAALWSMTLFLVLVVILDWPAIGEGARPAYVALTVLALYTSWRGWQAREALRRPGSHRNEYIDDVGFTLIALFDGFIIVSAIDLGSPVWFAVLAGVIGVAAGRYGVQRVKAGIQA